LFTIEEPKNTLVELAAAVGGLGLGPDMFSSINHEMSLPTDYRCRFNTDLH
jgi:hypothetical protein